MKMSYRGMSCLMVLAGALSITSAQASVFTTLYGSPGGVHGVKPWGTLISFNGMLFGVTVTGGEADEGTIFRVDPNTSKQVVLYSFKGGTTDGAQPYGPLVESGGKLYGITNSGGANAVGTVFEFNLKTGTETLIRSLDLQVDGGGPLSGLTEHQGVLYGATWQGGPNAAGTLFAIDLRARTERIVHAFDYSHGYEPLGALIYQGGYLYGTGSGGGEFGYGAVFKVDSLSGDETLLYSFPGRPGEIVSQGSLTEYGGSLYGEASSGGSGGCGSIFKIDLTSGAESNVYEFGGHPSDGCVPTGGTIIRNGVLYGTTTSGGFPGGGTIFSVDLATGTEALLYDFQCDADGCMPLAGLLERQGAFYGSAQGSWEYPGGVIFSFKPTGSSGNGKRVVHTFDGTDGAHPSAVLINGGNGIIYGTTASGGANNSGTAYQMDKGGAVETLYSFSTSDGGAPNALAMASSTVLLGTIAAGGANGSGTIVKLTTSGQVSILHSFGGADGTAPNSIVASGNGFFYGTTSSGGAYGLGTVFRISASGTLNVLHSFAGTDGSQPLASFIKGADGNFYGTTMYGGGGGVGTVFKMTPTGTFTSLHSFSWSDGASPAGGLVYGADGNLYGTSVAQYGSVYKISPDGTSFSVLCSLGAYTSTCGSIAGVGSGIVYGSDGNLYVVGSYGGPLNRGGLSQLSPVTGNGTTIYNWEDNVGDNNEQYFGGLIERKPGLLVGSFGVGGLYGVGSLLELSETPPE